MKMIYYNNSYDVTLPSAETDMNQFQPLNQDPAGQEQIHPEIHLAATKADLSRIRQPDTAMVIWRREIDARFQDWIDRMDPALLPRIRMLVSLDDVPHAVQEAFDEAGTPESVERDHLISDIHQLSAEFAEIMGARYLRIRLEVVTSNACRKFHVDAVTARLICTYRGTGTQYGLGAGDADPEEIYGVETGAPVVLRGLNWPMDAGSCLLHRSPPIEGTGETRFMMVLDPIDDPDEEG